MNCLNLKQEPVSCTQASIGNPVWHQFTTNVQARTPDFVDGYPIVQAEVSRYRKLTLTVGVKLCALLVFVRQERDA